jgi:hypothetical protein
MTTWWNAANSYGGVELPLLIWTAVCCGGVLVTMCVWKSRLRFPSDGRRYILIASAWAAHFLVCYVSFVELWNLLVFSSLRLSRAELANESYALIKAAAQMVLFSSWCLIVLSFLWRELVDRSSTKALVR